MWINAIHKKTAIVSIAVLKHQTNTLLNRLFVFMLPICEGRMSPVPAHDMPAHQASCQQPSNLRPCGINIVGRCLQATELLRKAPSLVDVSIPAESSFTVCGDVHGQFYDLLHIFELNGLPSEENPYLFNGAHLRCCQEAFFQAESLHSRRVLCLHVISAEGHVRLGMIKGNYKIATKACPACLQKEGLCGVQLPVSLIQAGRVLQACAHFQRPRAWLALQRIPREGLAAEDGQALHACNVRAYAGDFVDRGSFSVEVILTLMAWRVLLPGHMHMARGNHESKGMNKIYGFEGEVSSQPPGTLS